MAADRAGRSVAFAKTTRPAIGSVAPRERLFARLDGTAARRVAWIAGPAGAGKTTLAASYVAARGYRCLWYQVDPDDADPATLFHYLAHAARKLEGARAKDLPAFAQQGGAGLDAFARRFFRQFFARAKPPFALVFDNLHAVPAGGALQTVLDAAFGEVPKQCCALVTSRSEAPPSCARLRVSGEMVCIGRDDLRLDAREAAAIAELRGQTLDAGRLGQLTERTQGWTAGLVLMLEHAKLGGDPGTLPGDATPQVVFDYLAGEIFDRFDAKTREFLLRIACLPRMTGPLAQALSGEPKAARLLINLALNNYFVAEVQSPEGRSFQLHPLLRDFLRSRAAQDLPEALAPDHLRHAAALLRDAGLPDAAVSLLIEARDWPRVAELVADSADQLLAEGRAETLAAWLGLLPVSSLESDARLLLAQGSCRMHTSPRAARQALVRAFEHPQLVDDANLKLRACAGVIEATLAEFDDLATLDHWIGTACELVNASSAAGSAAAVPAALIAAMAWRDPGRADFDVWAGRAARDVANADELVFTRALVALGRGELAQAGNLTEELAVRAKDAEPRLAALSSIASGLHAMLTDSFESAMAAAREGIARAEGEGLRGALAWLHALAAAAALGAGDRETARTELQCLAAEGSTLRRGDRALMHYLRGWLASLDGDPAGAEREARASLGLAVEAGLPWLECLARAALACLLADSGDRRGAEGQLRGAVALVDRLRGAWLRHVAQLAAADVATRMEDRTGALAAIRAAFALGRECGLRHAPWWRARAVGSLCALALAERVEPEYAKSLVRRYRLAPLEPPLRVRDWPWPFRISTLGRFELWQEGGPVEFGGKGPGRPLELLKLLVALGGLNVRADQLADALWPHVDADYAYRSFTATLHRLRKLLGDDDALVLRDARLSLSDSLVWTDTWALEAAMAAMDEALRMPRSASSAALVHSLTDEIFALYRGPFLADESEQPAFIAYREQIRARLLRCLARLARWWEEAREAGAGAEAYLRCIDADPLFEAPYRNLMMLYQRSGEAIEARATYERLRTLFAARLKVMPSPDTQAVLAGLEKI